jgi:hypothetical protein
MGSSLCGRTWARRTANWTKTTDAGLRKRSSTSPRPSSQRASPMRLWGNWKITVEGPLRLKVDLSEASCRRFRKSCQEAKEEPLANVVDRLAQKLGPGPHGDFNLFLTTSRGVKCSPASSLFSSLKRRIQLLEDRPYPMIVESGNLTSPFASATGFGLRLMDASRNFSMRLPRMLASMRVGIWLRNLNLSRIS